MRRRYGAGPGHLLGVGASLVVAGAAMVRFFDFSGPDTVRVLAWFAGAIVVHDLVLMPAYTLLDRLASRSRGAGWVYVRVPALLSGLLGLVFLPEILRLGSSTFRTASGLDQDVYLERWLAWSAGVFLISGVVWLVRRGRGGR